MSDVALVKNGTVRVAHLEAGDATEIVWVRPWIEPEMTISLHPGTDSKGLVEYSTSPAGDISAGNGRWIVWGAGEVDYACTDTTEGRLVAIRARCTVGTLDVEVV